MGMKSKARLWEMKNWWICAEFEGVISASGYKDKVFDTITHIAEEHGKFNLLFSCKDYQGWEPDAARLSMESIITNARFAHRIAYVNPPQSKILQMKLFQDMMPNGTVRFFNEDNYAEALHWVREEKE